MHEHLINSQGERHCEYLQNSYFSAQMVLPEIFYECDRWAGIWENFYESYQLIS